MNNSNGPGVKNGNLFGFDCDLESSQVVVIPVCSDVTCSYRKGTAFAPKLILEESVQLDFYSPYLNKAWEQQTAMLPINDQILVLNKKFSDQASRIIYKQEQGAGLNEEETFALKEVNLFCEQQVNNIHHLSKELLAAGKRTIVLGGDHSSPLGLIKALDEKEGPFGILQIDAHADLREDYEGFEHSHASIMFNALKCDKIEQLVQVGVRDICEEEMNTIESSNGRIITYFDWDLKAEQFKGKTWHEQCEDILKGLPEKVYVSFDIDGLSPELCPTTGTPVPGGLSFEQASYLLNMLAENKTIIGADLCEVGHTQFDAIVGARVLYLLTTLLHKSGV